MTSTRRPRGHRWTNASTFQQSIQHRNVVFEEVETKEPDVLCYGSDHDVSQAERAAKRRKIEHMATDFVHGRPIFLACVRPTPSELRSIITRHKNSSGEPEFKHRNFFTLRTDKLQTSRAEMRDEKKPVRNVDVSKLGQAEIARGTKLAKVSTEKASASAACKPIRRLKTIKVSCLPAVELLKNSAEHRMIAASPDVSVFPSSTSHVSSACDSYKDDTLTVREISLAPPQSDADHQCAAGLAEDNVDISTAKSDGHDSDEGPFLPAHQPTEAIANPADHSHPCDQQLQLDRKSSGPQTVDTTGREPVDTPTAQSTHVKTSNSNAEYLHSYHTAPEPTNRSESLQAPTIEQSQEDDSQDRLLRLQGMTARPRRSWASLNGALVYLGDTPIEVVPHNPDHGKERRASIKQTLLESVEHIVSTGLPKAKRAPSRRNDSDLHSLEPTISGCAPGRTESQNAVDPDLPVDMQRRMSAFRPVYTSATQTQSGTTPLQYRSNTRAVPRLSTDRPGSGANGSSRPRRRVDFSTPKATRVPTKSHADQLSRAVLPQLDISFGDASLFAPDLDNVLTENVTNAPPAEDVPLQIQHEHNGDGERTPLHCDGTKTSPIAYQPRMVEGSPTPAQTATGTSQAWPGTQAALDRAEADLFRSPVKQPDVTLNEQPEQHDDSAAGKDADKSGSSRRPLSQGAMPSTQQMLEAFVGWSTVRKPRVDRRRSSNKSTPVARGNTKAPRGSAKHSLLLTDKNTPDSTEYSRKESIRQQSTSPSDSPIGYGEDQQWPRWQASVRQMGSADLSKDLVTPVCFTSFSKLSSAPEEDEQSKDKTNDAARRPLAKELDGSSFVFSPDAPLPSHEAAQDPREAADVSLEIDRLAQSVLSLDGVERLFSPVD